MRPRGQFRYAACLQDPAIRPGEETRFSHAQYAKNIAVNLVQRAHLRSAIDCAPTVDVQTQSWTLHPRRRCRAACSYCASSLRENCEKYHQYRFGIQRSIKREQKAITLSKGSNFILLSACSSQLPATPAQHVRCIFPSNFYCIDLFLDSFKSAEEDCIQDAGSHD
jgi:hypothetical protein